MEVDVAGMQVGRAPEINRADLGKGSHGVFQREERHDSIGEIEETEEGVGGEESQKQGRKPEESKRAGFGEEGRTLTS